MAFSEFLVIISRVRVFIYDDKKTLSVTGKSKDENGQESTSVTVYKKQ